MFTMDANFETILSFYDRLDGAQQVLGCSADKSSRMVLNVVDSATSPTASSEFAVNICNPALCNAPPDAKGCYQAGTCAFSGACEYSPQPVGTACNDGEACTEKDVCDGAGVCRGTPCVAPANATVVCGAAGCDFQCNAGYTRNGNACEVAACQPQCAGKECGPDGCGGSCGSCVRGAVCNDQGACVVVPIKRPPVRSPIKKPKRPDIKEPIPRDRPKALEPDPRIQPK